MLATQESSWSYSQWLESIDLGSYDAVFKDAQFTDLECFQALNPEDLNSLGITLPGVRKKLLLAAEKLLPHSTEEKQSFKLEQGDVTATAKYINDPVHGHMLLPAYCIEFIDTPQFQRLRDLKQLGTSYFVFPGASHNRFEHSLGVCHLSGKLAERLRATQRDLEITPRDVRIVRLAGLCHDLGHGPFSHAFEHWAKAKSGVPDWSHEDMSQKMVQYLIDEHGLDYSTEDVKFMLSLISGERPGDSNEKAFLYEIVANKRNSIDVDKFDYIARDCINTGLRSGFDSSRLVELSRVINNEICFPAKSDFVVYELFRTRYSLHKQIYSHSVSKAYEYMIEDAFTLADEYLGISDCLNDVTQYCLLTDCILKQIETSKQPELKPARDIIRNIRLRNHYKLVGEVLVPREQAAAFQKVTEKDIICCQSSTGYNTALDDLQESDIIVQNFKITYAMEDKNPVDNVHFFSKKQPEVSFGLAKRQVSMLLPEVFSEQIIRVFCRKREKEALAETAFNKFLEQRDYLRTGRISLPSTPGPSPTKPGFEGITPTRSPSVHASPPRILTFD